jgi:carbonic anhydrase/acetyltransferase-like protein (isoleucine patch superfamily)
MNIRSFGGALPQIAASAYVDAAAVVIGDVSIGEHASLWPMVVVRGDVNRIEIGAFTNIQDGVVVHCTHDGPYTPGGFATTIGSHVTIGHNAVVHACMVGDYSLIGMSCTVMDGAVLEPKVMLGAGSLVPPGKRLEGGHLWVGVPARRIRALSAPELELLAYSAQHYAKLKDRHLKG